MLREINKPGTSGLLMLFLGVVLLGLDGRVAVREGTRRCSRARTGPPETRASPAATPSVARLGVIGGGDVHPGVGRGRARGAAAEAQGGEGGQGA